MRKQSKTKLERTLTLSESRKCSLDMETASKTINTNRAEGPGALQYITSNGDTFTVLLSHVVES